MRNIKYIVIHCTATPQETKVSSILKYWKNNLKWKSPGYHRIIEADGTVHKLAEYNQVANGVAGYNTVSIHFSYIGGVDKENKAIDNRTDQQKDALLKLITEARELFPNAIIQGHKDFPKVKKACPSFNAKKEYENI